MIGFSQGLCHCHVCKQYKNRDYFYRDRTRTSGKSSRCIACETDRQKSRLEWHRQYYRNNDGKRRRIKRNAAAIAALQIDLELAKYALANTADEAERDWLRHERNGLILQLKSLQ